MSRSALTFTIITLVTIIAWVFLSVWMEINKSQISDSIKDNATELTGTSFDRDHLLNIYKRKR